MSVAYNSSIVTNGLVLALDAGNSKSYPGSGTTWTDLTNNGRNGTLTNGPTYSSANGGSLVFDGIDDFVSSVSNLTLANNFSVSLWLKHINSYSVQEKYISLGSDRIVIQSNENGNLSSYITDSTQQNLFVWGSGGNGRLGTNDTTPNRKTPITTFAGGTTWKQISCGREHTAAIKTDGTLWTWGSGGNGRLGTNNTTTRSTPVTTFAGGNNWKQISCGREHTAAIKTDGTLWTWGFGTNGGLGDNTTTNRNTPVTTFAGGTTWKSVSGGYNGTAAIKTDGSLWTWGRNSSGQLGTNDTTDRSTPITTFAGGTNWKQVSLSADNGNYTTAIKTDGSLWVWGANAQGQLGDFSTTTRSTPVTTFAGGNNWKQVSCGQEHTVAIKTDGSLWVWGDGFLGRLGITGPTVDRSTPITTFAGGTNWKQVSAGGRHTFAIKTDGTLWGWGWDPTGAMGTNGGGGFGVEGVPVTTFAGGNNWKQVAGGYDYTTAIKTNGTFINDDDSNISLLNTKYYNISLTCNGTTIKIHLDSVEILSTTISGTLTSTDVSFTISSLLDCFKGNISQVSIYNRALTTTEIQQNFNATKSRYF
jgi:alpha-tubulin suppressor-like RCC1 family protein